MCWRHFSSSQILADVALLWPGPSVFYSYHSNVHISEAWRYEYINVHNYPIHFIHTYDLRTVLLWHRSDEEFWLFGEIDHCPKRREVHSRFLPWSVAEHIGVSTHPHGSLGMQCGFCYLECPQTMCRARMTKGLFVLLEICFSLYHETMIAGSNTLLTVKYVWHFHH